MTIDSSRPLNPANQEPQKRWPIKDATLSTSYSAGATVAWNAPAAAVALAGIKAASFGDSAIACEQARERNAGCLHRLLRFRRYGAVKLAAATRAKIPC